MAKYKKLLKGISVKVALRARKCYHDSSHNIIKGNKCLIVKDGLTERGYCPKCAEEMVKIAQSELSSFAVSIKTK